MDNIHRIAVLADIHSNHIALENCVTYAINKGIHDFIFLGDYISDFPYPQKTLDFLYDLKSKYTCTFIRGNREDYFLNYRKEQGTYWGPGSSTGSLWYTYNNLREQDYIFLEQLPDHMTYHVEGLPDICICHGSPRNIKELLYETTPTINEAIQGIDERYILCGHTHKRMDIQYDGVRIVNPGSVGVPLESPLETQFAILSGQDSTWSIEMVNVPFDTDACIREFKESGLSDIAPYWVKTTIEIIRTGEDKTPEVIAYIKQLNNNQYEWKDIPEEYWHTAINKIWNNVSNTQIG